MRILNEEYIFEMANYGPNRTGLDFPIWVDSAGVNRNKPDNELRVKCKSVDKEHDITVSLEIEPQRLPLDNAPKLKKQDEQRLQDLKDFIKKHREAILAHQNNIIDDTSLGIYFTEVKQGKSPKEALEKIIQEQN